MIIGRVRDMPPGEIQDGRYDLTLFASGHESRCTHFAQHSNVCRLEDACYVLGFDAIEPNTARRRNDAWFDAALGRKPRLVHAEDDTSIYEILRNALDGIPTPRVRVDYTSMPRVWYAAVLNWLRVQSGHESATVDFVYSPGRHSRRWPEIIVQDIVPIPSCEGSPRPLAKTVLIVGLGYDAIAPFAIEERLEPDVTYAFMAEPGSVPAAPARTRMYNREFLDAVVDYSACLPIESVETVLAALTEVAAYHRHDANVTLVPLGPKPHVLAGLLLAFRMREVACLRIQHSRVHPSDVRPTGALVATRVELTQD
jgi:hypothetical protein